MIFGCDLVWAAIWRELCRNEITVQTNKQTNKQTNIHTYIHTYILTYAKYVYICMQIAGLKVEQNWPAAAVEHAS